MFHPSVRPVCRLFNPYSTTHGAVTEHDCGFTLMDGVCFTNQPGHLRLVLINGDELAKSMVRFSVGVRIARTVKIKQIDPAYFKDTEPE